MSYEMDTLDSGLVDWNPENGLLTISQADFPLGAMLHDDGVIALILDVEGSSYRPVGAAMTFDTEGRWTGSLSSGCIERDINIHVQEARRTGLPKMLRYGRGSPFKDIELPCGGGLSILVLPRPDRSVLQWAAGQLLERKTANLAIRPSGRLVRHRRGSGDISIRILPELRFVIFGKGIEAKTFASTVKLLGYEVELFSPDTELGSDIVNLSSRYIPSPRWPDGLDVDERTAVTLFFHDHDWEPPLLEAALRTPAFYIGAQGSLRAASKRRAALEALGVSKVGLSRLSQPFGLIPSVRDPRTMAVSVLADVLARAAQSSMQ